MVRSQWYYYDPYADYCSQYPTDFYGCYNPVGTRSGLASTIFSIVSSIIKATPAGPFIDVVKDIVIEVGSRVGPVLAEKLSKAILSMFSTSDELLDGMRYIKYNNGSIDFEISGGAIQQF